MLEYSTVWSVAQGLYCILSMVERIGRRWPSPKLLLVVVVVEFLVMRVVGRSYSRRRVVSYLLVQEESAVPHAWDSWSARTTIVRKFS